MADIELVIKIPEAEYEEIISSEDCGLHRLTRAIANGTVLPKGHGKLIDADEAIRKLCGKSCGCTLEECGYDVPCFSVQRINSAQTIIESDKEQKDTGFFDEIMDDESEDEETYEKIKEIINEVKEQEE